MSNSLLVKELEPKRANTIAFTNETESKHLLHVSEKKNTRKKVNACCLSTKGH